ncbi:hypothetical protein DYBT9275_05963 [Dyadobacter sp. CECT 9275]|uniref:WG repeat-containing protein n=1 Tax=Dyadobacter helix TaxID=2822344 RepID=A0A916NP21_9BACT|nr:WG repeat-containing protein [Dyadobacter sp. CECT 9275]CAG5018244.1 hypothetical protein DYBT9275_05963 [Dyadobacter sp. CECT 9275]
MISLSRSVPYLVFLLLLNVFHADAAAEKDAETVHPWLKNYTEYKQYGDVFVVKKTERRCLIYSTYLTDLNGKKLTPAYRDIGEFSHGLAEFVPFENHNGDIGMHGFINKKGKVVIPPIYFGAEKFVNGKTGVIYPAGKQYGLSYLDTAGNELYRLPVELFPNDFLIEKVNTDYVCGHDCKEDFIWWVDGNLTVLNWNFSKYTQKDIKKGEAIFRFYYNGKYGVIDKNFILKTPAVIDELDTKHEFSGQGLERARYGGKFGFISLATGEVVIPFYFSDTRKASYGRYWVKRNNKWGCMNKKGEMIIPHLFDQATAFTAENRSAVAINGKFGHIDTTGKFTTPLIYQFASYFSQGISMVRLNNKYGYIDKNGKPVTEIKYHTALPFGKNFAIAERFGLRYEIARMGAETFIGFSYIWKAVFIFVTVCMIAMLSRSFLANSARSLREMFTKKS